MTFVERVRDGLAELRRLDPGLARFGARKHRYQLEPPLRETELARLEARWGFVSPPAYRQFLLELGNGGAGPYYGVFRFGELDEGIAESWETWNLDPSRPFAHREKWNDRSILSASAPDPNEFETDSEHEAAYQGWLDSDACQESKDDYWKAIGTGRGCVPICHHGCGFRDWLVVTGPEAGHVWHDLSADEGGIFPVATPNRPRTTFAEWYLDWLKASLAELRAASS